MTLYRDWLAAHTGPVTDPALADACIESFQQVVAGKQVVLYGAHHHGRAVASVLGEIGVEITAFVDRRAAEVGQVSGIPVHPPQWLARLSPAETVLICATNPQNRALIGKDLAALAGDAFVLEDGFLGHTLLRTSVCTRKCAQNRQLRVAACAECSIINHSCPILRASLRKARNRVQIDSSKSITQTQLAYVMGQRCSLRCDNCCEGNTDIAAADKKFTPMQTILADVRKMAAASDFITVLDFAGGEPFLHPELVEILQAVRAIDNIGFINIFTNGTVPPKERLLQELRHERVTVNVSSYSLHVTKAQREHIDTTLNALQSNGCQWFMNENKTWLDCSSFDFVPQDEATLKHRFANCFLADCQRLDRGVLYRCVHQYAGVVTGQHPHAPEAFNIHQFTDQELAKKLDWFNTLPYISTCSHCRLPFDAQVVPAGEQRLTAIAPAPAR